MQTRDVTQLLLIGLEGAGKTSIVKHYIKSAVSRHLIPLSLESKSSFVPLPSSIFKKLASLEKPSPALCMTSQAMDAIDTHGVISTPRLMESSSSWTLPTQNA